MTTSLEFNLPPSIARNPSVQEKYEAYYADKKTRQDESCDMCKLAGENERPARLQKLSSKVIELSQNTFTLIENTFPYCVYDGHKVIDHDLLVPAEHKSDYDALSDEEVALRAFTMRFLQKEYNLEFTRSPSNQATSIKGHLHTHLFTLGSRVAHQHYDMNKGISIVSFEGEEEDIACKPC